MMERGRSYDMARRRFSLEDFAIDSAVQLLLVGSAALNRLDGYDE
jgi:hypothetical protein